MESLAIISAQADQDQDSQFTLRSSILVEFYMKYGILKGSYQI
jgi:hypothetical protein